MKKGLIVILVVASSCAPNIQAKQAQMKDRADYKKANPKPKNNYLPLVGIGLLSVWVVGRINEDN